MSTLRLVGPRYLITLAAPETETAAGIVIPDSSHEPVYDGLVTHVGTGRAAANGRVWELQAQAGDRVVLQKAAFMAYAQEWTAAELLAWGRAHGWNREAVFPVGASPAAALRPGSPPSGAVAEGVIINPDTEKMHLYWLDVRGEVILHGALRSMLAAELKDAGLTPPTSGFVADGDLIARIPGPDHDTLLPCGDYVLVEPERLYCVDEGATVQERPSGILVASVALQSGEERAEREGMLAYEESQRLWNSEAWQAEPAYYRHRRLHAYLDGLPGPVRAVCVRLGKELGEAKTFDRQWIKREAPLRGVVVAVGPGVPNRNGERLPAHTGLEGRVVRWSFAHTGVLLSDGYRDLLALPSRYVEAVEEECAA